jgi:hypothetical protein
MRFDVDAFAADHARPLTCVHRILDVEPDRCGVILRCDLLVTADQPFHTCVVEKRTGAPP